MDTSSVNGAWRRTWGFWSARGGWLSWKAYFALGMRAACESPEPDWDAGAPKV